MARSGFILVLVALISLFSIPVFAEDGSDEAGAEKITANAMGNRACTFEYMPVCGVDGKTYGNKCQAAAAEIEVSYAGPCRGVALEVAKCQGLETAREKLECLRKIGANVNKVEDIEKLGETPFQKCKRLDDEEAVEKCFVGLKENIREELPEMKLRKCAEITDDAKRAICKAEVAKPAAIAIATRCDKFTETEDKKKCLVALKEGVEEAVEVKDAAYACAKKYVNDEPGKLLCIKKLREEAKEISLDCSVFDNDVLRARCEVCAKLSGEPVGRASCVYRLRECRLEAEGSFDPNAAAACVNRLDDADERENRCKNIEGAGLKAACLKAQYGLKSLKSCDGKNAEEKAKCVVDARENIQEYLLFNFQRMLTAIEKLEAEGYLTAEELANIKAYVGNKRDEFQKAQTAEEKRAIIKEVAERWKGFRDGKVLEYHLKTIKKRLAVVNGHIQKLETLSAELKEAGKDTARLDAAILKVKDHLGKVAESKTFKEAQWRLRNITLYLNYIKRIINAIRENKPLEVPEPTISPEPTDIPPLPEPSVTATPAPSIEGSPTPTPTETPTPSPTA